MPDDTAHARLIYQLQLPSVLPPKPQNSATQAEKKAYSENVSKVIALAVAQELRNRGLDGARPTEQGLNDRSGAERRMAGGIGAKKVDVTWATEESGLILAFSIKSINFKDNRTGNYQKNLTNRRGDLLFESITLHRRFPYSVLVGLFFLDEEASRDGTDARQTTFENANQRLLLFTGRNDPAGRDEQYEHLYVGLLGVNPPDGKPASCDFYAVGAIDKPLTLDDILDAAITTIGTRNADLYTERDGKLIRSGRGNRNSKDSDDE
jgi:hypothetical protein